MSSYLDRQKGAFSAGLASAAGRLYSSVPSSSSRPTPAGSPALAVLPAAADCLAPSSPSPSAGSATDNHSPAKKRKREANGIVYSQPELTGYGTEVNTQMTFVIEYLKRKAGEAKTIHDILDHLSLHRHSDAHKETLVRQMRLNPRIRFEPEADVSGPHWTAGTYRHNPVIPNVGTAEALLGLLQERTDASGVSVRDLKDGWPECDDVLGRLEAERRIRMVRSKKDARVWVDDPSLCHDDIDTEFKSMWLRVSVPSADEIVRKLIAVGLKPASEDPMNKQMTGPKPKQQKKRATRKIGKATNTHMEHLLKEWNPDGGS